MAEAGRVNDHDSDLAIYGLSLFECCCCHSSEHEPVQLKCLHYYCRSCFDASVSRAHGLRSTVTCPACSEVTDISTVLKNSFLSTYKRTTAVRAEIVWCNTCERNKKEEIAEFWCVVCTKALCHACLLLHDTFIDGHCIFEVDHARSLPLRQLTHTVQCNLHKRAMDAYCVACCLPKCTECLESCRAGSHDLLLLSDDVTQKHMSSATDRVRDAAKRLSSLLPGILQKCRAIASRVQSNRSNGNRLLAQQRSRVRDSTLWAFEESANEVCRDLRSARYEDPVVMAIAVRRRCAANIEAQALSGVRCVQLLAVRHRLRTAAAYYCFGSRSSISINGTVSLTCDIMLSACFGSIVPRQAAPPAPLLFHAASVRFKTPVRCWDLAATRDGQVLLAAREHGLFVYGYSGQQLSIWRPAKWSDGWDDEVYCVASLSDRRAAVGVYYAQLIVLLKLSQTGDSCQEDRRVAVLQSHLQLLAAHGDLLAAAEGLTELKLLRLSSGQLLYTQSRDHSIDKVALTALCVVTTSRYQMKRNSGATSHVLEAFSHSGQFLWSYEISDEEAVFGICVSADTWSRVYVAVGRRDRSSSRVMAIGGANGRGSREVLSSETHGLQRPWNISLARGQQRTLLIVLSVDGSVSLYEAMG